MIDHEGTRELTPPLLGQHRPDFYAQRHTPPPPPNLVVGEAKSRRDFTEGSRSQAQVKAFIHYLSRLRTYPAQQYHPVLILCTALDDISTARRFLRADPQSANIVMHLIDATGFEHFHA